MKDFFTNPWVSSIISGILVWIITTAFTKRKESKEYRQKIHSANNEILYAIRPLIVEELLPSLEMFNAIRVATAKKYIINSSDLYDISDVADELTKETMDNSFLSPERKISYSKLIMRLYEFAENHIIVSNEQTSNTDAQENNIKPKVVVVSNEMNKTLLSSLTAIISIMAFLLTLLPTVINFDNSRLMTWLERHCQDSISEIVYIILIPATICVLTIPMLSRVFKDAKNDKNSDKDDGEK